MTGRRPCREFWDEVLGRPTKILAPMVGLSELAFRMFARSKGAEVCYTEMLHADRFGADEAYRRSHFATDPEDRPLVAQFCGDDAATIARAARFLEGDVDAVELNCGCPQRSAERGHFGAFLGADVIVGIVEALARELRVPVMVKMRIRESADETARLARALEAAGCAVLTLHCRTRDQRRGGPCDWAAARRVRDAVDAMPVVANGGVERASDVEACLLETRAGACMSGEGALENAAIFSGAEATTPRGQLDLARDYLAFAKRFRATVDAAKAHLAVMLRCVPHDDGLAAAATLDDLGALVARLEPGTTAAPSWYRRHRSSEDDVRAFLASHADASLVAATGHVRCESTGHEMAPQLPVLESHWAGKAYARAAKKRRL